MTLPAVPEAPTVIVSYAVVPLLLRAGVPGGPQFWNVISADVLKGLFAPQTVVVPLPLVLQVGSI